MFDIENEGHEEKQYLCHLTVDIWIGDIFIDFFFRILAIMQHGKNYAKVDTHTNTYRNSERRRTWLEAKPT